MDIGHLMLIFGSGKLQTALKKARKVNNKEKMPFLSFKISTKNQKKIVSNLKNVTNGQFEALSLLYFKMPIHDSFSLQKIILSVFLEISTGKRLHFISYLILFKFEHIKVSVSPRMHFLEVFVYSKTMTYSGDRLYEYLSKVHAMRNREVSNTNMSLNKFHLKSSR